MAGKRQKVIKILLTIHSRCLYIICILFVMFVTVMFDTNCPSHVRILSIPRSCDSIPSHVIRKF